MGVGFGTESASKYIGGNAGMNQGKIDSNYQSVTAQAGIYVGSDGFDMTVKGNTGLKGAVIDSQAPAEKNQLTTGTLTWEDTKNKAEYEAGGIGIQVNTSSGAKLNEQGITPSITLTVRGDALYGKIVVR